MIRPVPARACLALAAAAVVAGAGPAHAQTRPAAPPAAPRASEPASVSAEGMRVEATTAYTWREAATGEDAVLLEGPVRITAGGATLAGENAVLWLRPDAGRVRARVALLGGARVEHDGAVRTGGELIVSVAADGVSLVADERLARDASTSELYVRAAGLRPELRPEAEVPEYRPQPPAARPVVFSAEQVESRRLDDGTAIVLTGGAFLLQEDETGGVLELQGERAVLFTAFDDLQALATADAGEVRQNILAAYVEGDVRVRFTPSPAAVTRKADRQSEQRLEAERVYYDLRTDRAVLTDAVLRTREAQRDLPVTLRAQTLRQLARGRYEADDAELSFSRLAVPEYAINASRIVVDQRDTGDARLGTRTSFRADDLTMQAYGAPVFYLPRAGGAVDERGFPLESLAVTNSRNFGTGILSRWGAFETLGLEPPAGADASYRLDYYTERGPAVGLDFDYGGANVTDAGAANAYDGVFTGYLAYDEGTDDLARRRVDIDWDGDLRGMVLLEHQHYFPGGWQGQLRAGYVSDATWLEEWDERRWRDGLPTDVSAYLRRADGSEQFGLLLQTPTNDFVTTSNRIQEQFELRRLPEASYFRSGDALGARGGGAVAGVTFYSANTAGLYEFVESDADFFGSDEGDLGYRNRPSTPDIDEAFVGTPSAGFTGREDDLTLSGDFRQQLDLPIKLPGGAVVPYVMGRYTGYADSPGGGDEHRLLGGVGVRGSVSFVKVDENARSELFDVDRVRHVVEPAFHVFASAQTTELDDVFVYEQFRDGYSDLQAASVSLRQRWQTKRGGPGAQRTVDFLTFDLTAAFFGNTPEEVDDRLGISSVGFALDGFRGKFFDTRPENSIARDHLAAEAAWRVSDTTIVLADATHNLDENRLATAAAGFAAQRGQRLNYNLGVRYLGEVNVTLATAGATYLLGDKYTLRGGYFVNINGGESRGYDLSITRGFERYVLNLGVFVDEIRDEAGVRINLAPKGLGYDLDLTGLVDRNR